MTTCEHCGVGIIYGCGARLHVGTDENPMPRAECADGFLVAQEYRSVFV